MGRKITAGDVQAIRELLHDVAPQDGAAKELRDVLEHLCKVEACVKALLDAGAESRDQALLDLQRLLDPDPDPDDSDPA